MEVVPKGAVPDGKTAMKIDTISGEGKEAILPGEKKDAGNPARQRSVDAPKQRIKTIVIDPGHGGKDPGAIGPTGVKEKEVVLAISLALYDLLKKNSSFTLHMTRSTDIFIPLMQRTQFANEKKADLFISIHANSISGDRKKKNNTKGFKIYFLSQAKNEEDKLAAMIENSVIRMEEDKKGNALQNILIDMENNEFLTESQEISIRVAQTFQEQLTGKIKPLQMGVGQANFWVLNGTYMPSILIETCFISSPLEEKYLVDKKIQKTIAIGITEAIVNFKSTYETGL
jgi:N-acetylmuramoyl-L-alanine amidase